MTFHERINIQKSEEVIILGNFVAWNFSINDFSENTGHDK
jgi:hypothetical protein